MVTLPHDPTYDRDIEILVRAYKKAIRDISNELSRLELTDMSRANSQAALAEVAKTLASLNDESAEWVKAYIPKAATDGVVQAIIGLGVAETVDEAAKIAKFNRLNREFVATAIADTQADLLAVTQNIDRKVRIAVRQATADAMRANLAKGINGRRTISRDILANMRNSLGEAVNTGIIDAAGRRWKPEAYVEMVTRTKMAQTHREVTMNEALGRGAMYGRISRHGAKDACANYEGMIVKLTPDAPGNYRYVGDLPRREIFHPRCRHTITPVRDPLNAI
ncbi:phage minor capsid protein [Paenibacillus campinasensis]|uniref:Minor capsid protein n=1 Tax=Paenibacillus campinasensis TaxID=66347 RepID=A0A268EH50_9BACL|nr:phage minor capsid protein [Paenibacillus campinasensis]PAD72443.1 minor capsid protein [Paenibacillus campinasensis]